MPMGPIQNPHIYWRVTGPPGTPTSTGGSQAHPDPHIYWRVTGPPGTPTSTGGSQAHLEPPHLLQGSQAHLEPPHLLQGSQDPACKTSWDPFPVTLGPRE